MKHVSTWEKAHTRAVAEEVQRLMVARNLSASSLAQKASEHGVTMTRSMIQHLYSGRRQVLNLTEVVALAAALDVPLVQLIYPGDPDTWTQATATQVVTTQEARANACAPERS